MLRAIKRGWHRIEVFWAYFPLLWRDFDWDHSFLYELLEFKLRRMADYHDKYGVTCNRHKTAKTLRICATLCKRLIDDEYEDPASDYLHKIGCDGWKTEPTDHPNLVAFKPIKEMTEAERKRFIYLMERGQANREYDKDYLFKLMRQHIDGWWD